MCIRDSSCSQEYFFSSQYLWCFSVSERIYLGRGNFGLFLEIRYAIYIRSCEPVEIGSIDKGICPSVHDLEPVTHLHFRKPDFIENGIVRIAGWPRKDVRFF